MPITIDGTGTITGATTLASTVASPTFTTPALGTPASGDLTNCTNKVISGTAQASTSGTSIDFTGLPSGVKRVTVMFNNVSPSGTAALLLQLGDSGGFETSGYAGSADARVSNSPAAMSSGFILQPEMFAGSTYAGTAIVTLENSNAFTWTCLAIVSRSDGTSTVGYGSGVKSLTATLNSVRITLSSGSFDAGEINILYES